MGERRRRHRRLNSKDWDRDRRTKHRRINERRRNERIAAEIMVEVETSGKRTYRRTANFSLGGVGFHAPVPFRLGSELNLTLRLVGPDKSIRVKAEVVGIDENGRGNRVRFIDLSQSERSALENHLELFKAPTQVGVPPAALLARQADKNEYVREGICIVEGQRPEFEFRVRSADKIVGRDPKTADIVINHPSVSRRHAHIFLQNGRHVITDLSSTNGVLFQSKPIHSLVLKDGIVFRLGKVQVQYFVTKKVERK